MEIRQITEQNPWWEDKAAISEDEKVKESIARKHKIGYSFTEENQLITGPRQVGKTTFIKLYIKNLIEKGVNPKQALYFSCDVLKDFNDIVEIVRISDALAAGKKYLFFDEITFVDDWQRAIKFILDSPMSRNKIIHITGSSSIELKKETFPGRRIKTVHFMPLSFKDFCMVFGSESLKRELAAEISSLNAAEVNRAAKKLLFYFSEIDRLFSSYTICGGFPRSMYELMEDGKIRDETYDIYWKWLVADIAKAERSERIASSTLLGVLKNYGTRFSLNSIAKEMEIGSHVTIREYLEILENLFVLRNMFPIDLKKGVEAFARMRKAYFIDPFLFHVFKRELTKTRIREEEVPRLIEGIVAEHLARKFGRVCYYYQKKEVDFYVEDTGIELKWQNKVKKSDFSAVELKNKILLSKDSFEFIEKENMAIVPASVFLLL
ncbi:MAG: ATP-binding protein [Nanoarchaeota archaeon]|nr:ATP-binding protein [Nanoarchaeota archaeon]